MANRKDIRDADVKILWGLAAARCSFPKCPIALVAVASAQDPSVPIGEMAHIVASSKSAVSPRPDPSFPDSQRDTYPNLILLCPNHHTVVDKQPNTYTSADLQKWKTDHETWVRVRLKEAVTGVTFVELELVAKTLAHSVYANGETFILTPPAEKMNRNSLQQSQSLVTLGMANQPVVQKFVQHFSEVQPRFADDLKAGFLAEYAARFAEGLRGDALYSAMLDFASAGSPDFIRIGAGLSILAYLFVTCEIFQS